jgi:hypothetical protein
MFMSVHSAILTEVDPTPTIDPTDRVPVALHRFEVVSDGMSKEGWVDEMRKYGYSLSMGFRDLCLSSQYFSPSNGKKRTVVIIPGWIMRHEDRKTGLVRELARKWRLSDVSVEDVLLVSRTLTLDDFLVMGYAQIAFFHKEVLNGGFPHHTVVGRPPRGSTAIYLSSPNTSWPRDIGFAFMQDS